MAWELTVAGSYTSRLTTRTNESVSWPVDSRLDHSEVAGLFGNCPKISGVSPGGMGNSTDFSPL